ncbi:hypothetical protein CEXT_815401 [Caerostris extrusa]|uniref:Uncharacterized protein n=1 Tax=Caerostris extrusa TaxID=172846 RepID=A0AAV4TZJ9_CAEEX|nr:hypothetical protein CEXT_815401 [Caerostris extrusa]
MPGGLEKKQCAFESYFTIDCGKKFSKSKKKVEPVVSEVYSDFFTNPPVVGLLNFAYSKSKCGWKSDGIYRMSSYL